MKKERGIIRVGYPSGREMRFEGTMFVALSPADGGVCPVVKPAKGTRNRELPTGRYYTGKEVICLDPRAQVYVGDKLAYHPRNQRAGTLAEWAADWLAANPDWAPVAGMEELAKLVGMSSQAEGAFPNGTRIIKVVSEAGDAHRNGSLGRVEGSMRHEEFGLYYAVFWDDRPGVPVHLADWKIAKIEPESN